VNRTWRYHAVAGTFWQDRKIRTLSEDGRTLAIYLLTCPDRTSEGFYGLPRVLLLDHLGWFPDRLTEALTCLADADFAHYDDDAEVVFVTRALKYNTPRGIKSIRGGVSVLDSTHGAPDLFARFLASADRYAPEFAGAIRQRYGIVSDGSSKGLPISEH